MVELVDLDPEFRRPIGRYDAGCRHRVRGKCAVCETRRMFRRPALFSAWTALLVVETLLIAGAGMTCRKDIFSAQYA
jgi:hypothetical protein